MPASANKFNTFVGDLASKVHDLVGTTPGSDIDQFKVYLSNAAPSATDDSVKADLAEITNENGYAAPVSITPSGASSNGTVTLTGSKITITANGGTVGPFRYVVLYNDTPTSPADPLVLWWDYGSSITLNDGESFTIKFNSSDTTGTVLTIT